jgi:hypothetical protein
MAGIPDETIHQQSRISITVSNAAKSRVAVFKVVSRTKLEQDAENQSIHTF